ncbi:unnamed protein product (macronuclear) [Paramecium tetraurelia]|uniref:Uncharacterized protein n=1 Tax=Paramecium tetraurelia TaxID=5888 RepID=A0DAK8_PARTE|nr:uncharacterized protein GSPATT00014982001 [Paramecium tetraurelia]CAK80075.1 unnamed protein product [Paramecium tetraurelia]|eukprot:XP_001447472.1 hypothetical protein (macronuclear) [Paramecium tetraurelia strain d4-2]
MIRVWQNKSDTEDAPFQHNYLPTLGLNLVKKEFAYQGQQIKLCLWDTAGQDKYFSLTKNYFQRADGVIMVFDIADKDSFNRISDYWIKQVQECSKANSQTILVGNKIDLCEKRQVKFLEVQEFSQKYKLPYFEVSAKTGEGVQEAFNFLSRKCTECIETEVNEVQHLQIDTDNKKRGFQGCVNTIMVFVQFIIEHLEEMIILHLIMSMKKTPNQSSGIPSHNSIQKGPKFIKDVTNKSRSEHNQSFDATYSKNYAPTFSNQSRLKSYSQQANFLDDLEEEQYPNQINVAIQKRPFELALQNELQKMLSKIIQGQHLSIEDCQSIIRAIDECIQESLQTLRLKDAEVQNVKQTYELKIHQYENTILALENEVQELKHMITLNPNDSINFKLQQLEQENEMLKLQNQQAIKLAVQGRTKKQEKELYEAMNSSKSKQKAQVNNYSILLNQQQQQNLLIRQEDQIIVILILIIFHIFNQFQYESINLSKNSLIFMILNFDSIFNFNIQRPKQVIRKISFHQSQYLMESLQNIPKLVLIS